MRSAATHIWDEGYSYLPEGTQQEAKQLPPTQEQQRRNISKEEEDKQNVKETP